MSNLNDVGPMLECKELGPIAMCFNENKGWISETLGPTSRHWKRLAREVHNKAAQIGGDPINGKCVGPTPLQELDPNISDLKRRRGSTGQNKKKNGEEEIIGSGCSAAPPSHMNVIAWNYRGLGSSLAVRTLTDEVRMKKPQLVFLSETKAGMSRIKGI